MRWNRVSLSEMASRCAASRGARARWMAWRVSLVLAEVSVPNTRCARESSCPERSSGRMVFSNVGTDGSRRIAATSASCCRIPSSIAGWKCSLLMRVKSGAW